MARVRYSDTRDWELMDSDHDLRGRDLWDAHGHRLGRIEDLVVDTSAQRVDAVVVDSGEEYLAEHLSIGEDAVYVLEYNAASSEPPGPLRPDRRPYEDRGLRRRDSDPSPLGEDPPRVGEAGGYAGLADGFRGHYRQTYGDAGLDFADWEPAYRFGYDAAYDNAYAGRGFDASEEALRRGYYQRHGYPMSDRIVWRHVRGAVQHAFEEVRRSG